MTAEDVERLASAAREAATDPALGRTRLALAKFAADVFERTGNELHVLGFVLGPDRATGASPWDNGTDETVGVSVLLRIGAHLTAVSGDLIGRQHTYAILKEQLFDADLRLRGTLDRIIRYTPSIPVGLTVFVIFDTLVAPNNLGGLGDLAGGATAAVTTFAIANLKPVRDAAARASATLVPSATRSAVDRAKHDLESYRSAAVELAKETGGRLDGAARTHLRRLGKRSGIPDTTTAQIEQEIFPEATPQEKDHDALIQALPLK